MKSYHLARLDALPQGEYGQKARRLYELSQKGFPICEGFALPEDWMEDFLDCNGISRECPRPSDILSGHFPDGMSAVLAQGFTALAQGENELIVRSSAQQEDGFERSFAGIYESVAHVASPQELEQAVKRVWASACSEGALAYHTQTKVSMGVIIQSMLRCEKSGVLFTRDPMQWEEWMLLEAKAGGNESITAGEGDCQRFRLRRSDGVPQTLSSKDAVLSPGEQTELFLLAHKAERAFGFPCDLEWGMCGGRVTFFQLRPQRLHAPAGVYHKSEGGMDCVLLDRYALPATVCYLSLLDEWQSKVRLDLCAQEGSERPLCFAYNRVYWNVRYQREQYEPPEGVEDRRRQELTGLIRRGYRSWYRRIPRYQARVRQIGRSLNDTNDAPGLIALLDQAVWNFCVYFGVDHFQFLGIAQLLYRQLQQICPDGELRRQAEQLVGALSAKNKTVQANQELLKIARELRSTPTEQSLVERYSPNEAYRRIGLGEAPVLARRLAHFCRKHGHRSVSCDDLAFPHWGEAPQRVVALLAQLVSGDAQPSGGGKGLKRQCARLARRMSGSGVSYRQAKECLKLTGEYMRLRENQRYYFDQSWVLLRQILLRLGQLFTAQGRLQRPDAIFHLTIAEVRVAADYPAQPISQALVEERARLFEQGQHAAPPYMLKDSSAVEVQKGAGASSYKGLGISPGTARGTVCLVRDVDDLGRLRQGDIGVVRTFHPSWTPMLRVVSGLIMSYGNLLSHGAVVAREYGVPVAVFNGDAMQALHNGDKVDLNGSTGRIRVLHPADEAQNRQRL